MTQNQLRYWELRWKQHYENQQVQIDWAKVRLDYAKLEETIRHNKVAERQEQQRIIQEQIKINQTWAEIDRKERAMAIDAAFKYVEATQKNIALSQEQEKIAKSWYEILSKERLAVAEQVVDMWNKKVQNDMQNQKMWMDAIGPIGKAFGMGAIGLIAGSVANAANRSEFDKIYTMMQNMYPQYAEFFGPQAASKFYDDAQKYVSDLKTNPITGGGINYQSYQDWKQGQQITEGDKTSEAVDKYLDKVSGFTGTDQSSSDKKGSSGSKYYDKHTDAGSTKDPIETKTSGGTRVIYSGGSHYGPGFSTQGGFY